jgi:hypothetical protein
VAKPVNRVSGSHGHSFGLVTRHLLRKSISVFTGSQRDDLQPRWVSIHNREGAPSNRAGRAENGEILHVSWRR